RTDNTYTLSLHDALPIYAEPHAEHLKKPTAVRRPGSYSAGRCVKTSGQLSSQGLPETRHHTGVPEKCKAESPTRQRKTGNLLLTDRKSTRLNSSHGSISY